ncbi:MAG: esterase-like activity of phytase family protein [Rhizobiales bacterium]|nr:esterase-like activity of phytase family protein [Hyphomicrobiales bacterium]
MTITPLIFDRTAPEAFQFGALEWRGGIEIRSTDAAFGGISGIRTHNQGNNLLAITDVGQWISADIHYRNGRLVAIDNVFMAPILGAPGERLSGKYQTDAEGMGFGINGDILIAFERRHRIARYDVASDHWRARASYIPVPDEIENLFDNKGIEAIGQFADETISGSPVIAIAERFLDQDGNHTGWLLGPGAPVKLIFARIDAFDITALTILPDGRLIILERSFSFLFGPAMRLRLVEPTELRAGRLITGRELLRAENREAIDNMEGLANHLSASGETILTLVSDNNFNDFQRTLILQFALPQR